MRSSFGQKLVGRYCAAIPLVLYLIGHNLLAAEPVQPPKPPFIKPLPERISWVMKPRETPADQPSDSPLLRECTITKYDGTRRQVQVWSNGRTTERWRYQGMEIFEQPDLTDICILRGADAKNAGSDFSGMSWLSEKTYQGIQDWDERPCYFFRRETQPPAGAVQALSRPEVDEVWIDVQTGRPAAWKDGAQTWVYTFSSVTPGPLVLPDSFRQALLAYQKALAEPEKHRMKL